MDFAGLVSEQLQAAQGVADGLVIEGRGPRSERVAFLERQLQHVIAELRALESDIESGLCFGVSGSGGISFGCEFEEIMECHKASISNLRGMIQSAKILER